MLTQRNRDKILAGLIASVLVLNTAGCANDKDWQNDNSQGEQQEDKNDDDNKDMYVHHSYPWWWMGSSSSNSTTSISTNSNIVRSGEPAKSTTNTSKIGSAGSGKSGIGSGASRSSAVS